MTAVQKPTTPVAPKIAIRVPFRPRSNFSCSAFSTLATIAAAVVNEPAGSAKTEIRNGGTIAFFAASNMSSASDDVLAADEDAGVDAGSPAGARRWRPAPARSPRQALTPT